VVVLNLLECYFAVNPIAKYARTLNGGSIWIQHPEYLNFFLQDILERSNGRKRLKDLISETLEWYREWGLCLGEEEAFERIRRKIEILHRKALFVALEKPTKEEIRLKVPEINIEISEDRISAYCQGEKFASLPFEERSREVLLRPIEIRKPYMLLPHPGIGYKMFHLLSFYFSSQGKDLVVPEPSKKKMRKIYAEYGDYWKILPKEDRELIKSEESLGLRTLRGYLPEAIHWYPTYKCNFRCIHCSREASPDRTEEELSPNEKYQLIEHFLEKTNLMHVSIVGEPFILPEILGIMEFLAENRVYFLVATNGWFVNKKVADKLAEFGPYLNHVEISIDGASPETHDYFRGRKGAFKRAIRAIRLLRERGILVLPQACIHSLNKEEIPRIWDVVVKEGGADHFRVIPLMDHGRGKNPILKITGEEVRDVYLKLKEKYYEYEGRVYISRPWEQIYEEEREMELRRRGTLILRRPRLLGSHCFAMCKGFLTEVTIEPDGSYWPCSYLVGVEEFKAGKFPDDIVEVWLKSEAIKRFSLARLSIPKECYPCSKATLCRGKCVAEAYLEYFDYFRASPKCSLANKQHGEHGEERRRENTEFTYRSNRELGNCTWILDIFV